MSASSKENRIALDSRNEQEVATIVADTIRRGYAAIIPTDTIYGLAVNAADAAAVDRLFALKRRPASKPIPIFVRDVAMAKELAYVDGRQEAILERLWPGPFTFVLEKRENVSTRLSAGTDTIGLRIPDSSFCRLLLQEAGVPLTGSSANVSGMETPPNVEGIIQQFREHSMVPEVVVDAGATQDKTPSTVIDIRGEKARILRMSATSPAMMRSILEAGISI